MLRGRFGDSSGRPYIEGRLIIPRLNLRSDISFLVDTGADRSVLLVDDAAKMRIDYSALRVGERTSVGIGGTTRHYVEPALVTFEEAGKRLHVYEIELAIARSDRKLRRVPSLLGRDILDRWKMSYDPSRGRLTFDVVSTDHTFDAR